MKLLGIEKIEYEKKDGGTASGVKLYYAEEVPTNKRLEGCYCNSVYIPKSRFDDLPGLEELELGCEFDILYNRFGGVKDIKLIN